jgi:hypothetical protein
MAATVVFTGPLPPQGSEWCGVCARVYKGVFIALETTQAAIADANRHGPEKVVTMAIKFPPGVKTPQLSEGVVSTMIPLPTQVGTRPGGAPVVQDAVQPVKVCWSHIAGLQFKEDTGLLVVPAGAMPHEKGAALLGGQPG